MKEIEAKFLEINPDQLEDRVKRLGLTKEFDTVFKEAILQPPAGKGFEEWEKTRKRIRVRDTGKEIELALKENEKWGLSETSEIEVVVDSFDRIVMILESAGLEVKRLQEKRRIRYVADGVKIEIDFWPWIPPSLEIEGDSEQIVKDWSKKLELDWEKADFRDSKKIYLDVYGIDVDQV